MPHVITPAPSGRAKCRACKRVIAKGELRLGEAVPNAFGEGEALHFYHLLCGAFRRPEAFLEASSEDATGGVEGDQNADGEQAASASMDDGESAAASGDGPMKEAPPTVLPPADELAELRALAEASVLHHRIRRFSRAALAPSGRARCQGCRELIEKGALRFVLERIDDGVLAGAGFVHVGCARAYAGTVDKIAWWLTHTDGLPAEFADETLAALSAQEGAGVEAPAEERAR